MARKTSGRRGAAIIALIAVIAALAGGPSAASVVLSKSYDFGIDASWAEE